MGWFSSGEPPRSYDKLWPAMASASAVATPLHDDGAWAALSSPGILPHPWAVWTLIGLVRHRRRQLWVADIVCNRLGGDLRRIAVAGSFGHPEERAQRGPVPGLPEWEYYFHGCGCCLTHRVTGEEVDVDFDRDGAEGFDVFFFRNFLQSLREPEPPERRLIELHPSFDTISIAFDELVACGLLKRDRDRRPRLTEEVICHEGVVDTFCATFAEPARRVWAAVCVDDWLVAEAAIASDFLSTTVAALVRDRAAAIRRERGSRLRAAFKNGPSSGLALVALAEVGDDGISSVLTHALRGEVSGTTSAALEVLVARSDGVAWCPEIERLLQRLNPDGSPPHPYLFVESAKFLLRHTPRALSVLAALSRVGGSMVGEAALLALEYAPELAVGLFRKALRSPVPASRITGAAVLGLVDCPWSRAELLALLAESDDQEATIECRTALQESRDPIVRAAVTVWEELNPREPESGPYITGAEMMLRHAPEAVRYEMEKWNERVAAVRKVDPTG